MARPATPAIRVLVRAVKGGRAPTQILPGLMLNDESGVPNKQVQEILAGKGVLPLAIPEAARSHRHAAGVIAEAFPDAVLAPK